MTKKGFDSTTLRIILISLIVIMVGGLLGGYFYTQDWLVTYAKEVNKTSSELAQKEKGQAQAGLASDLDRLKPVIEKASSFVPTADTYLGIATKDINKYASETGVEVTEISPTQLAPSQSPPATAGLQVQHIKIVIKNPVTFTSLIKFIKSIETNIPKMRLTGINLTHTSSDTDKISVDPITLGVYTK